MPWRRARPPTPVKNLAFEGQLTESKEHHVFKSLTHTARRWYEILCDHYLTRVLSLESESCSVISDSLWPHGLYRPWNTPGQNTGVGTLSLFQGIFQTQGSNPDLPHCRQILYQLSHKGSPRILEWVTDPFSGGSSQPRNQTRVSCIAGEFFTNWVIREASLGRRDANWVQVIMEVVCIFFWYIFFDL